jgi:hypothetical protein
MKCDWAQKVSLLVDGELAAGEARDVERHLDLCGDCQTTREDFLTLRRQIADYPLELDAFARQRALKRVLAAGGDSGGIGGAKFDGETAGATTRGRRERFAGGFGMPRLGPVGLAALLLLLVGVGAGVVSLLSARRAPVEVVKHVPTPAPAADTSNSSSAATRITSPAPNDLTAGANKEGEEVVVAGNGQKRAGDEPAKGANERATGGTLSGALSGTNARRFERAGGRVPKSSPTPRRLSLPRVDMPVVERARNDAEAVDGGGVVESGGASESGDVEAAAEGMAGESNTARHVEQAQLLLRSFRNARPAEAGRRASSDLAHDKRRSKKLLYENIVLRREAASRGNLPVESLLDSLEPILIDIANLPDKPAAADVRQINERMRRKNLVAMLQISAVESAAARSY